MHQCRSLRSLDWPNGQLLLRALGVMSTSVKTTLKFLAIISAPFIFGSLIYLGQTGNLTFLTAAIAVFGIPIGLALVVVVIANTGQPYVVWNAKDLHKEEQERDGK